MKRKYGSLMAFLIACSSFAFSAEAAKADQDCRARPAWCVDGYTCEPTSCTTRSTVALERLGAQLVAARAERPRWFRPFLEGGVTWSVLGQEPGMYAAAGVHLWRLEAAVEVDQEDVRIRAGFRWEK